MKSVEIIKCWFLWRKVKSGKDCLHVKKGCGYYLPTRLIGVNPIGRVEEWEMESGKTAIVKLKDYSYFRDPSDMIKESVWEIIGYKGEPKIKDMSFHEFKKMMLPDAKEGA